MEFHEAERGLLLKAQAAKQVALSARQQEETRHIKIEYQTLKATEPQRLHSLVSLKQQKLQARGALQEHLERRKSDIDMDQLLDFVHDQKNANKKRKRAVLQESV